MKNILNKIDQLFNKNLYVMLGKPGHGNSYSYKDRHLFFEKMMKNKEK